MFLKVILQVGAIDLRVQLPTRRTRKILFLLKRPTTIKTGSSISRLRTQLLKDQLWRRAIWWEVWCREKRRRVAEETKKTNALSHCCWGTQAKFKVLRTPQNLGWAQDFSQVLGVLFWTCRVACLHIPDHQRAYESPYAGRAGGRPLFLPFLLLAIESPHFSWEHDLPFKRYISQYPLQIVVLQISCQWMWTEGACATSRTCS